MRDLIVGIGVVTAVFCALFFTFEPILGPALTTLLGVLK